MTANSKLQKLMIAVCAIAAVLAMCLDAESPVAAATGTGTNLNPEEECGAVAWLAKGVQQELDTYYLIQPKLSGRPPRQELEPYEVANSPSGPPALEVDRNLSRLPSNPLDCSTAFAKMGIELDSPKARQTHLAAGKGPVIFTYTRVATTPSRDWAFITRTICYFGTREIEYQPMSYFLKRDASGWSEPEPPFSRVYLPVVRAVPQIQKCNNAQ